MHFEGDDVLAARGAKLRGLRRHIQMIFQDPYASLNPRKLLGSAIAEPMLVHGVRTRDDVDEELSNLLQRVGLDPASAERFLRGQRQRICIARALSLSPKLIIADEAVSALDVSIKAQLIDLMIDLQREFGLSYLFISHDVAVVERISHRVTVRYRGEIVEIGPRDAVINTPHHSYTKCLMSAVLVPDPRSRNRPICRLSDNIAPAMHEGPSFANEADRSRYGSFRQELRLDGSKAIFETDRLEGRRRSRLFQRRGDCRLRSSAHGFVELAILLRAEPRPVYDLCPACYRVAIDREDSKPSRDAWRF